MMDTKAFFNKLTENGIEFFTGVPDSLLKDICAYITDNCQKEKNIIAANEGGAIALATGYHLATGKIPMVYMQNSGIGNAVNPLLSLVDSKVYCIPMLLMIGWRGEPGIKDEPQHIKQGEVTLDLFDAMNIPYEVLPADFEDAAKVVKKAIAYIHENNAPFALIIRKGAFIKYELQKRKETHYELTREEAIKQVIRLLSKEDVVVSTTGKTSRELFEFREQSGHGHEMDFLTVGCMGHASQIALGIALEKPDRKIFCFDGDGAVLMHTGSMGIIGDLAPKNFKHIIFNNGAHDSVGGQPTIGFNTDFGKIAEAFNYKQVYKVDSIHELKVCFEQFKTSEGSALLEICVNKGARKDLGRPTTTPLQNKQAFMQNLK